MKGINSITPECAQALQNAKHWKNCATFSKVVTVACAIVAIVLLTFAILSGVYLIPIWGAGGIVVTASSGLASLICLLCAVCWSSFSKDDASIAKTLYNRARNLYVNVN